MPPGMGYGHDPDIDEPFHVEDQVREAFEHVLSEFRVTMRWPRPRRALNFLNRLLDFGVEIQPESRQSGFVEGDCFIHLDPGLWMDDDRLHEYFARNSRSTFSAGSPTTRPLSISSPRRF